MHCTAIAAATLQAYRETDYRVLGDTPFVLRIGQASAELAALQRRHAARCSAFLTACNPYSQPLEPAANARRHAELGQALRQRGLVAIEGQGQHPSNAWPAEASYLVLGLTQGDSTEIGRRFEQNAIVWSGEDAVPQLVLLR